MKTVLVLDEMPTRCDDCRLSDYGLTVCHAEGKEIKDGGQRQDYCPLKEMPMMADTPRFTGGYQCFHCLSNSVSWDNDLSFEDYGLDGVRLEDEDE